MHINNQENFYLKNLLEINFQGKNMKDLVDDYPISLFYHEYK